MNSGSTERFRLFCGMVALVLLLLCSCSMARSQSSDSENEIVANLAFGDPDYQTLYITARTTIYKIRVITPGHHR